MRNRDFIKAVFWIAVYLVLVLAPLFALLLGPNPPGRGFWWEFSVALGFSGGSMLGIQFALTARFKRASAPYGIDLIYHFHREVGLTALALVLAHPVIFFAYRPSTIVLLNPLVTPHRMLAGLAAALAIAVLIGFTLFRRKIGMEYDSWRLWHAVFALTALGFALGHILGVGYYVAAPWKRSLWIGYVLFWALLLVYTRVVRPYKIIKHPYVVEEVRQERGRCWTVRMRPDGHRGFSFLPGQFAWVDIWYSPFGFHEHPFSFSSSAAGAPVLEFTIKEMGDFTSRIKDLKPGERAYVDGPYGIFTPDRYKAEGYVFIAGGIGIAPVMSMLRSFADRAEERPLLLVYAGKTWDGFTFAGDLEGLKGRLKLSVIYVLEDPPEKWKYERGLVTARLLNHYIPEVRTGREYFICGPPQMMQAVEKSLHKLGVPVGSIHSEIFNLV